MKFTIPPALALASLLSPACQGPAAPPDVKERVAMPTREEFRNAPGAAAARDSGKVSDNWIATFSDSRLNALVQEAESKNPDLAIAAARRNRALAEAGKADSALSPKVDAVMGAERASTSSATADRFNLGLSVSWEADVWGRLADASKAAELDAVAAQADYEFARQSIAAQVATAWFLAISAQEQLALDKVLLVERQRVQRITQARFDVGEARQLDLDLVVGQSAAQQQAVDASQGALESALRSLEALLGRYPSQEIEVLTSLPELPPSPPVGLPSELLERRPDLVAADRRVAAAFNRVGSAKAAKLPRIGLTAGGGLASRDLSSLFDPGQAVWNLGANLLGPLFDGGEREAQVRIAQAAEQESLANYVKVAQRAFLEVETALANERILRLRDANLQTAEDRLLRARNAGEERYKVGEMSILDVDQLHTDHAAAAKQRLQVRQELFRQRINLHLALGGSFEARAAIPAQQP
jgi:NodT family efflux transporter outer membrane factor (OMF) lipoprotein